MTTATIPDPCGLVLGRLASASTAVVGAVLAILRVPDWVGVTIAAIPDLNRRPAKKYIQGQYEREK